MVQIGQVAPDFVLEALKGDRYVDIGLSDYSGKWVVLFFWPLDFSFVCPTEILEFSERAGEFEKLQTQILGASVDSKYAHQAWTQQIGKINFPMMSDITKEVSRKYGVLVEEQGVALRGTFIINPEGEVEYISIHNMNVGRNVDEIIRVLEALQTGELCPVDWEPGQKTLGDSG